MSLKRVFSCGLFFMLLACLFNLASFPACANLIANWSMTEGSGDIFYDSSGNGLDCEIIHATYNYSYWVSGPPCLNDGDCYFWDYNTSNTPYCSLYDYANCGNMPKLHLENYSEMTLCFSSIVLRPITSSVPVISDKNEENLSKQTQFGFYLDTFGGGLDQWWGVWADKFRQEAQTYTYYNMTNGTRYFVCLAYDTQKGMLYINTVNTENITANYEGPDIFDSNITLMGFTDASGSTCGALHGYIQNLLIFDSALTPENILSLYESVNGTTTSSQISSSSSQASSSSEESSSSSVIYASTSSSGLSSTSSEVSSSSEQSSSSSVIYASTSSSEISSSSSEFSSSSSSALSSTPTTAAPTTTLYTTTTIPQNINLFMQGNYFLCLEENCTSNKSLDMTADYFLVIEQRSYDYFTTNNLLAVSASIIGFVLLAAFIAALLAVLSWLIWGFVK